MSSITVRPYESKDFHAVLNFDGRPSKRRQQKLRMLELPDVFYGYVAEDEDGIIGFIVMQDMGDEATHQVMQINAKEKRKGIGRRLMKEVFHRQGRGKHITLAVLTDNLNAIAFYEALGFQKSGHTREYKKGKDYFWYCMDV